MISFITLKCSNCGASLQISQEMDTFACGYCGASQIVERSGGTVSLKLLTNAISKVQVGTDKTAAELAIRRLKEELQDLEVSYQNLELNLIIKNNATKLRFRNIWIMVTALCVIPAFAGGWIAIFFSIVWIAGSGTVLYFYGQENTKNEDSQSVFRKKLFAQGNETERRLIEQRNIVDS